ncbi:TPA: CfrBI family restriction endonuclease, partial [Enterococcus faecium]
LLTLWTLGLTKKSLDNIVRGRANLEEYINNLNRTLDEAVSNIEDLFGNISGEINLNGKIIEVNWDFISLLFTAIGAQTLTIRGSDKSTNGKFFERLILGSSLSMMGFQYMEEMPEEVSPSDKLFILSSTESNERETDATVIYNNKAISIDIGFIGGGNPEISADKVTRFRSDKIIGKIDHQMVPLIIVDTINNKTVIKSIASSLGGTAIEMRDKYWIRNMAKFISDYFDINCYFEELEDLETLHSEISVKLKELDLQMF